MAWTQDAMNETDRIGFILKELASGEKLEDVRIGTDSANAVVVADGKPLTVNQTSLLEKDSFDIVLDIPNQSLKIREDHLFPDCDLGILGKKRFNLLENMLENPHTTIGVHNVHLVPLYEEGIEANSLSKSIGVLRSILQPAGHKGPWIVNTKVIRKSSMGEQITGYGYRMSPNYKYLVILEKISNSQDFPLPRPS